MPDPILHHYDASPFSQKAQKMMGIKGLTWQSVEMPMTAPKPDIEAITGGYRGTPVLQVGSDIFIDTVAIADALDHFFPEMAVLCDTQRLHSDVMGLWADQLFDPVLRSAVALYAKDWDDHFYRDRAAVFPHLDFPAQGETSDHRAATIARLARQLDGELNDGRLYLQGSECGLADVHCWGILWFVRNGLPHLAASLDALVYLPSWFERLDQKGVGMRQQADFQVAKAALQQPCIDPVVLPGARPREAQLGSWWDTTVAVCAVGADRGTVVGTLVSQGDRFTTLRVEGAGLEARQVHFPRSGYDIRRA